MFDNYSSYAHLPVSVRTLIASKVSEWSILQIMPVLFITLICQISGAATYTIPAIVLTESTAYYALGVTIWLTGLSPGVFVYSVRVMAAYFLMLGVPFLFFSSITSLSPWYSLSALVLFMPAWFFIKKGGIKWEGREQPLY